MARIDVLYNDDKKEKFDSHSIELKLYSGTGLIDMPFSFAYAYECSKEEVFKELKPLLLKNIDSLRSLADKMDEMIKNIDNGNGVDYIEVNGLGNEITKGHYPDEESTI